MMCDFNEEDHNTLNIRWVNMTENNTSLKELTSFCTGPTEAIQSMYGGPITNGTVIAQGNEDQNGRWYKTLHHIDRADGNKK